MRESLKMMIRERLIPWGKSLGIAELPDFALEEPPRGIAGDLSCNLAMTLGQSLKKPPRTLAQEIITHLQALLDFLGSTDQNIHWKGARP